MARLDQRFLANCVPNNCTCNVTIINVLSCLVLSISNGFFIWLCCFFPDQSIFLEENRVTFRDAARNTKPTLATVQTAVEQYNEFQQFETSLRKLSSGWEEDEDQKSEYSKITR